VSAAGCEDPRPRSVVTATIDGPVSTLDWTYALGELHRLSGGAATPGYCAHAHFLAEPTSHSRPVAIAECAIFVEGSNKVVVAGTVGTTMRSAVDELTKRLRRRLGDTPERELEPLGPPAIDHRGEPS
jgi:hypothetical protein